MEIFEIDKELQRLADLGDVDGFFYILETQTNYGVEWWEMIYNCYR